MSRDADHNGTGQIVIVTQTGMVTAVICDGVLIEQPTNVAIYHDAQILTIQNIGDTHHAQDIQN